MVWRWWFLSFLWLCLFSGLWQGCSAPSPCSHDGVGPLFLNPDGYPCEKTCECNNQRFHGECIAGVCQTLKTRVACNTKGDALEVRRSNYLLTEMCPALSSSKARRCTTATFLKVCQPPSLQVRVWGDCLCTGTLCGPSQALCGLDCRSDRPCSCISLKTDPKHCGACNRACPSGYVCQQGQCLCSEHKQLCAGSCVDTQNDAKHCGGCNNVCKDDSICAQGRCQEVRLSPGTYRRGTPSNEVNWNAAAKAYGGLHSQERPHLVTLTRPFLLGRFEVTQGWFAQVMGYNPTTHPCTGDKKRCPVQGVTLSRAMDFCNRLSLRHKRPTCYLCEKSGSPDVRCRPDPRYRGRELYNCLGFRLPTSAEWEFAARAGTTAPFPSGSPSSLPLDSASNVSEQLSLWSWFRHNAGGFLHPVGAKKANLWGLFDMRGNVAEWSWSAASTFTNASLLDPVGSWDTKVGFVRGGSLRSSPLECRAGARRKVVQPHDPVQVRKAGLVGFRIARTLPHNAFCTKSGLSDCGSSGCIDTSSDRGHCGRCGHRCTVFSSCQNGRCVRDEVKINTRNADGKPKEWLMGFKAYDSTDTNRGCFRTNTRMFLTKFAQDYFIGKYEVRQRDFKALMGFNPSYQRCAHCPVESVTWFQALLFANKLSEKFGLEQCFRCRGNPVDSGNFYCELKEKYRGNKGRNYYKCPGYRLPTAAEWEYMARLEATRQPFCKTVGNVAYPSNRKEYERQYCPFGMSGDAKAAPLCYPNSLGVYDLYLSVREWVWDGYSHNHHDFVDGTVTNYAGLQPTPTSSCFHCVVNDYPSGKQCFPCVRELRGFHYLTVGNHKGSETLRFFWHVAKLTRDIQRKSPARVVGFRVARSILTSTP